MKSKTQQPITDEILNIDYHTKRLIIKALNKSPNIPTAARLLGYSEKTLYNKKRQYNIVRMNDAWVEIIQIDRHEEQKQPAKAIATN